MSGLDPGSGVLPNGAAHAAFVSAGIGAFAVGIISLLNAIGVLPLPSLYGPAGGVTGRTTLAVLVWLISWGVLHARWKHRHMETRFAYLLTIGLTILGILFALPPLWSVFG